jgi:hypothetical protein
MLDRKSDKFGQTLFLKNWTDMSKKSEIFVSDSCYLIVFRWSRNGIESEVDFEKTWVNQKGPLGFIEEIEGN